jgi:hypothetical protein
MLFTRHDSLTLKLLLCHGVQRFARHQRSSARLVLLHLLSILCAACGAIVLVLVR